MDKSTKIVIGSALGIGALYYIFGTKKAGSSDEGEGSFGGSDIGEEDNGVPYGFYQPQEDESYIIEIPQEQVLPQDQAVAPQVNTTDTDVTSPVDTTSILKASAGIATTIGLDEAARIAAERIAKRQIAENADLVTDASKYGFKDTLSDPYNLYKIDKRLAGEFAETTSEKLAKEGTEIVVETTATRLGKKALTSALPFGAGVAANVAGDQFFYGEEDENKGISRGERARRSAEAGAVGEVAQLGTMAAGAAIGATIGSVVPVAGTAIGAAIGAVVGIVADVVASEAYLEYRYEDEDTLLDVVGLGRATDAEKADAYRETIKNEQQFMTSMDTGASTDFSVDINPLSAYSVGSTKVSSGTDYSSLLSSKNQIVSQNRNVLLEAMGYQGQSTKDGVAYTKPTISFGDNTFNQQSSSKKSSSSSRKSSSKKSGSSGSVNFKSYNPSTDALMTKLGYQGQSTKDGVRYTKTPVDYSKYFKTSSDNGQSKVKLK